MIKTNFIIVEVEEVFNNKVTMGNTTFQVNTSVESVEHINRVAKVKYAPEFVILEEGDEVIIHHNILRARYSIAGNLIKSEFWVKDNLYSVPLSEVFMYKRDSEWSAIDPYCFIKPIQHEAKKVGSFQLLGGEQTEDSHKGQVKLTGTLAFSNKALEEQGVFAGDEIVFSNFSEYEFNIDGVIYYKMSTKDILAKI